MKNASLIAGRFALLVSCIVAVCATYVSYTTGYLLAYNDATAHLNTARRIIDSLTPGLVQIGSVWLPLLHLFELPFVTNYFLWQSGLAGSIVSGISFIIASFFLYKLIFYISKNVFASLVGVFFFITNINLLYLQSTPMFEPLLMATAIGAVFFLTKWSVDGKVNDLILAAFCTMLATLTRYDGWALFLAMSGFVLLRSILKRKNWDGPLLLFLLLAGFGIGMWFLYNYLIFSDPLYFARGEFSAAAQQLILQQRGQLPTKHDMFLSAQTYSLSTLFNVGVVTTFLGTGGVVWYALRYILKLSFYAPLLLLTPFAFNIVSLYLGQSVIWLPMIPPHFHTYFNARYGILMLPAASFFIGFLSSRNIIFTVLLPIFAVVQIILFLEPQYLPLFGQRIGIITLQDTVSSVNQQTIAASNFLHHNYRDGLILVSTASSDAFVFRTGIPLREFITEGTGHFWKESLQNPTKYAQWLVFFQDHSDRVGKQLQFYTNLQTNYTEVFQDQTYQIWKKTPKGTT